MTRFALPELCRTTGPSETSSFDSLLVQPEGNVPVATVLKFAVSIDISLSAPVSSLV